MSIRVALCSLMIILAALPDNARCSQPPEPAVKLHMLMGRPVVDGVFLNGQGPFRFLFDTGAQSNQVQASIARKLGLTPIFQTKMDTVSGAIYVAGGRSPKSLWVRPGLPIRSSCSRQWMEYMPSRLRSRACLGRSFSPGSTT